MLGDICVGIAEEPLTVTECGEWKGTNSNRPIEAGSVDYIGGIPRRLAQQGQTMVVKAQRRYRSSMGLDERAWETSTCEPGSAWELIHSPVLQRAAFCRLSLTLHATYSM